jgi:NADH-quinone oxidoreductase subunit K
VIHVLGPYILASVLVGIGVYGIVVRRNAVLLLVGVELVLSGTLILFVTAAATGGDNFAAGSVLPLFVITIAAAEVVLALSVILAVFRHQGVLDLDEGSGRPVEAPDPPDGPADAPPDEPADQSGVPVGAEATS